MPTNLTFYIQSTQKCTFIWGILALSHISCSTHNRVNFKGAPDFLRADVVRFLPPPDAQRLAEASEGVKEFIGEYRYPKSQPYPICINTEEAKKRFLEQGFQDLKVLKEHKKVYFTLKVNNAALLKDHELALITDYCGEKLIVLNLSFNYTRADRESAANAITDEGFLAIGDKLTDLEELVIKNNRNLTDRTFRAIADNFPNLKKLDIGPCRFTAITDIDVEAITNKHPKLEELVLDMHPESFTDRTLQAIANLKSLKTLKIRGTKFTDIGLTAIAENCTELEELVIRENRGFSDRGFHAIAKLTKLKKLDITDTYVTDRNFQPIAENLTNLEELILGNNLCISDSITFVADNHKNLRKIYIDFTSISSKQLDYLLERLPTLEIWENNNHNISAAAIRDLRGRYPNAKIHERAELLLDW